MKSIMEVSFNVLLWTVVGALSVSLGPIIISFLESILN